MTRSTGGPSRVLLAIVLLAMILSLLPTRFLRPWSNDLGAIAQGLTVPLADPATRLSAILRPASGGLELDGRTLPQIREELERYRASYLDMRRERDELLEELELLTAVRRAGGDVSFTTRPARIVGRSTQSRNQILQLNVGTLGGAFEVGTVAVVNAVHLVGRVSRVGRLTSELVPISDPSIGPLRAFVLGDGEAPVRISILGGLMPAGDGTLVGDVERDAPVEVGMEVRLDDAAWPPTAQMMILGDIEFIRPKDQSPLRKTIVVRPRFPIVQLDRVILKIEGGRAAGSGGS